MTALPKPAAPRQVGLSRALAPDVARGLMLLLIALAHAPGFVSDRAPTAANSVAELLRSLLAENQARAMFIVLFGYAMGQLMYRQEARGTEPGETRRLLRRRGLVLVGVGLAHYALLVPVDIVATYGFALLFLAAMVSAGDRALLWAAAVTLPFGIALIGWTYQRAVAAELSGEPSGMAPYMSTDYVSHVVSGLPGWLPETVLSVIVVVPGMLFGLWAARRRYLDELGAHAALLRRVAFVLLLVALVTRLPEALVVAGFWVPASSATGWALAVLHTLGGCAGGVGLAALVGVLVSWREPSGGPGEATTQARPVATALAALGERSLTFYLAQSLVWLLLFYPFTLNLVDTVSFAGAAAIAVGVWIASVAAAAAMARAGRAGPAEVLVRKLAYRTRRRVTPG
ncbi:DUF418 domain-containing protein [Promicromonospora kroppenstedtii]|uniref:DUF418 domain-containing protein n=1 Tax=Promicromonospora kroppenstedtii TaxID=440482 RepID=UPI0004BB6D90|nr:DUF418 domain-containing protein [Promicromonospora kroppenstedtii]